MAGSAVNFYRNYDSTDTTYYTQQSSYPAPTIAECGWTTPAGYDFLEWNESRDGTGTSVHPGDIDYFYESGSPYFYAIWEPVGGWRRE